MKFKPGARVFGIQPVMIIAMMVVEQVYRELENLDNCVFTSCTDGEHKKGSDHYVGNAIDVRIWGFDKMGIDIQDVADKIASRLTEEYEVIVHSTHIHIGFDPQKGLNHD